MKFRKHHSGEASLVVHHLFEVFARLLELIANPTILTSCLIAAFTFSTFNDAKGQGTVWISNLVFDAIDAPVYLRALGADKPRGTNYFAQLYAGTEGTAEPDLVPVGVPVFFRPGPSAGFVSCQSNCAVTIPDVAGKQVATVQMRAWSAKGGITYESALRAAEMDESVLFGKSNVIAVRTGDPSEPTNPFPRPLLGLESFFLSPLPLKLNFQLVAEGVELSWPGYASNAVVEAKADLSEPNWIELSAPPVIVNGRNVVTNTTSGSVQFYRLRRP